MYLPGRRRSAALKEPPRVCGPAGLTLMAGGRGRHSTLSGAQPQPTSPGRFAEAAECLWPSVKSEALERGVAPSLLGQPSEVPGRVPRRHVPWPGRRVARWSPRGCVVLGVVQPAGHQGV